jgi:hypothetical protein
MADKSRNLNKKSAFHKFSRSPSPRSKRVSAKINKETIDKKSPFDEKEAEEWIKKNERMLRKYSPIAGKHYPFHPSLNTGQLLNVKTPHLKKDIQKHDEALHGYYSTLDAKYNIEDGLKTKKMKKKVKEMGREQAYNNLVDFMGLPSSSKSYKTRKSKPFVYHGGKKRKKRKTKKKRKRKKTRKKKKRKKKSRTRKAGMFTVRSTSPILESETGLSKIEKDRRIQKNYYLREHQKKLKKSAKDLKLWASEKRKEKAKQEYKKRIKYTNPNQRFSPINVVNTPIEQGHFSTSPLTVPTKNVNFLNIKEAAKQMKKQETNGGSGRKRKTRKKKGKGKDTITDIKYDSHWNTKEGFKRWVIITPGFGQKYIDGKPILLVRDPRYGLHEMKKYDNVADFFKDFTKAGKWGGRKSRKRK